MKSKVHYRFLATSIMSAALTWTWGIAPAEVIFSDGFESANFATTMNGSRWGNPNRTSIVRDDGYVVDGVSILSGPFLSRLWENGPSSTGHHALRFRYPAGEPMSEQRFSLGTAHPELWLSFWLRVPLNFSHPTTSPNNQKLFALWMDGYSQEGDGSTIWLGFFGSSGGSSSFAATYSNGGFTASNGFEGYTEFIRTPDDRGRWMQIVVHVKTESVPKASDGLMEVWRRWEGDASFTKTQSLSSRPIKQPASGPAGFAAGYLMGWANGKYPVDTEFLIDDFMVSTTSLLLQGPIPKPPSGIIVQ